jgi:hypothetical protein
MVISIVDSKVANRLLMRYTAFVKYLRKMEKYCSSKSAICRLWKSFFLIRRGVLYGIFTEGDVPMKVVALIKIS